MSVVTALLAILPLALVSVASSVPIATTLSILTTPARRPAAFPYMVGTVLGLLGTTLLFTSSLSSFLPLPVGSHSPLFAYGQLVVGVLLIVGGTGRFVWQTRHAGRTPEREEIPEGASLRPRVAAVFGVLLNLRPKALLLAAAVGVIVTGAQVGGIGALLVVAVYVVVGSLNVTGPVLFYRFFPAATARVIGRARGWFARHGALVVCVATGATGVFLVIRGWLAL